MARKSKKNMSIGILLVVSFITGLILGGIFAYHFLPTKTITKETIKYIVPDFNQTNHEYKIEMNVPAVDSNNHGVVAKLITRLRPGSGLVMVSINDVLAEADTQQSARTAARVASRYTNISLENYDIIYSIKVNASVVGGPSAGAAFAISTILALENKTLNKNVMITGTINSDGTIGPVGSVPQKAEAVKKAGANVFLVPLGHATQVQYKERRHCEKYGSIEYCQIEYIPERINIGEKYNITLVEVRDINEALPYFTS